MVYCTLFAGEVYTIELRNKPLSQNFYNEVYDSLYSEELKKIRDHLTKNNFAFIYVNEKDHPLEFFNYLSGIFKSDNSRKINCKASFEELPSILQSPKASSIEFLMNPGTEIWWVSRHSPSRVTEVAYKSAKGKWAKKIIMFTDDKKFFKEKSIVDNRAVFEFNPLKKRRLSDFIEHYALNIGCEEFECISDLNKLNVEVRIEDVEKFVDYIKSAIKMCRKFGYCKRTKCSGISIQLAEKLLLHNAINRQSILLTIREKIIQFLNDIYSKTNVENFDFRFNIENFFADVSGSDCRFLLDSIIIIKELANLQILCIDFENRHVIFSPLKEKVFRIINNRILSKILERSDRTSNSILFLDEHGLNNTTFQMFNNLLRRQLSDDISLNLGIILWLRRELLEIFPESCPSQIEVSNILFSNMNLDMHHYKIQWNKALDFYQSLEKITLSKNAQISLISTYLERNELFPSKKTVEIVFQNLISASIKKLEFVKDPQTNLSVAKYKDTIIQEIYSAISLAFELNVNLTHDLSVKVVEFLSDYIISIDYQNQEFDWRTIALGVFDACLSLCNVDKFTNNVTFLISEVLRFESNYEDILNRTNSLNVLFKSIKSVKEDTTIKADGLDPFYRMIASIFEIQSIISSYDKILNRLTDAKKMINVFESLFFEILQWSTSKKRQNIINNLLIYDVIGKAFGLYHYESFPWVLDAVLSKEFDDVVLFVIDAMPKDFIDFFRAYKKSNILTFPSFVTFPSETAPGHLAIFSGLPPVKSHVLNNEINIENHLRNLIDTTDKARERNKKLSSNTKQAINEISKHSLTQRLKEAGIETTIYFPNRYKISLLSTILLGGSLDNASIYACTRGVGVLQESKMIPSKDIKKGFYVILDNELDSTQHQSARSYCFSPQDIEEISEKYEAYFKRLTAFIEKITINATKRKRKMMLIITADHGNVPLKQKDSHFLNFLNECGLDLVESSGKTVYIPEPRKLKGGIYSNYVTDLLFNCKKSKNVKIKNEQFNSLRIGYSDLKELHHRKRVVQIFETSIGSISSKIVFSVNCSNCGYTAIIASDNLGLCPNCYTELLRGTKLGSIKERVNEIGKKYGYHLFFPNEPNSVQNSSNIQYPYLMVFPPFESIISKYPSNPRERIMFLLKNEKKAVPNAYLSKKYSDAYNSTEKGKNEFEKSLQDLIHLGLIEENKDNYLFPITEDYSGTCTYITHGGISPFETIVPLIILTNEVTQNSRKFD